MSHRRMFSPSNSIELSSRVAQDHVYTLFTEQLMMNYYIDIHLDVVSSFNEATNIERPSNNKDTSNTS